MMRTQIKALSIVVLCLIAGAAIGLFSPRQGAREDAPAEPRDLGVSRQSDDGFTAITLGTVTFRAGVADTDEERAKGLSGRSSLGEGEALLFVFPYAGSWGIWMKDMLFPIDIVWADAEGRIVTVRERVAPETFPEAFYPSEPSLYVVELPAGAAARHRIVPGGKIIF